MVRLNQNRSKLLLGCGSAALAMGLVAAPQAASAQAIQATENVSSGVAFRNFTGTGTETISVATPVAVIDWTPDEDGGGNALDFLPNGNTVTFQNDPSTPDFAVLNRILPATNGNITVIDGQVISQIVDGNGLPLGPGGTIAFYSPTGLLIGPGAVFDVGNLILTTLDPDQASFADFATNGGQLQMVGNTGTTASIVISPGAQIFATAENSYFAVTAAEIQMFGLSDINGSTAFVAGEQVNLTVSNGLFDIQIPVGTSVTTPIIVDGLVGGPSSNGVGDNHLIYAVAAAQVDPISMIFRGNLGFQPAATAGIVNGEIILSANYEVSGRFVDGGTVDGGIGQTFGDRSELTNVSGSIFVEDIFSSSSILAIANDQVQISALNTPSLIDGNLLAIGRGSAGLSAINGQSFDITGDVLVSADNYGVIGSDLNPDEFDIFGGQAFIEASNGGVMNIAGDVFVSARAFAGVDTFGPSSGSATGGSASIAANAGSVTIGGNVDVATNAAPAEDIFDFGDGNIFTAGISQINATQGGSILVTGDANVAADAEGTIGSVQINSTPSSAFGGQAFVQAIDSGSSLTFLGNLQAHANAMAGISNSIAQGGPATGGEVSVFINADGTIDVVGDVRLESLALGGTNFFGQGGDGFAGAARAFIPAGGALNLGGDFTAVASGFGGNGIGGGNGFGGIAGTQVIWGTFDISGAYAAEAAGFGGDSNTGIGGDGGDGVGGNSFLQVDGTLTNVGTIDIGQSVSLISNGRGGRAGDGDGSFAPGRGGDGTGGQIQTPNQADPQFNSGAFLLAGGDNGNLTVGGSVTIDNFGIGGDGGNGGPFQNGGDGGVGTGGTAQVGSFLAGLDGSVGAGTVSLGDVTVIANGDGGDGGTGGSGALRGNGGDGNGGNSFFTARAGTVDVGLIALNGDGTGGDGHVGGTGTGGIANPFFGTNATIVAEDIRGFAIGRGGFGDNLGGSAFGGQAVMDGGPYDLTIADSLLLDAGAFSGDSAVGPGGDANGGIAQILVDADETSINVGLNVTLRASATGGNGVSASAGATGFGGSALLSLISASFVDIGGALITEASARGGDNLGTGAGGDAIGGARAFVFVDNNGVLTVGGDYDSTADAQGGAGNGGGSAFGGVSGAQVLAGSIDFQSNVFANSTGTGGNSAGSSGFGGNGGDGLGGYALVAAQGTQAETGSISIAGDATLLANGIGGSGGLGDGSTIAAGSGGEGRAGSFNTTIVADDNETGGARLIAGSDNGDLTVVGTSLLNAVGIGGTGGSGGLGQAGGRGGDAFGGFSQAGVVNATAGVGTATFGTVNVLAGANGGGGGFGGSTQDPQGDGGDATGFRAQINANGGTVVMGNVVASTTAQGGDGFNGGNAVGGDRAGTATNTGGSLTTGNFSAFSLGIGGTGTQGVGGSGLGGQAFVGAQDGTTVINGDALANATGQGGNSAGGDGGDGTGGIADISIFVPVAGSGTITGNAGIIANGIGGEGAAGFTGGVGTGGTAYSLSQAGGSLSFGSVQVTASGRGGSGPDSLGGEGVGGLAYIEATDSGSALTIQNSTPSAFSNNLNRGGIVTAVGIGGQATGGTGIGGTGTGGTVMVSALNGGSIALPANPQGEPSSALGFNGIIARGFGGNSSVDGGAGGLAIGGSGTIIADGGSITSGAMIFSVFSFGGSSLNAAGDIDGGDAQGGDRVITVDNGGTITAEFGGGVSGGVGGDGSGQGNGGSGTGGTVNVSVLNGTLNVVGSSAFIDGPAGGAGAIGGDATGGTVNFSVIGGTVNILPNASNIAELLIGGAANGGQGINVGGDATGSDINVLISNGTIVGGTLVVEGSGRAGNANGTGGTGTGGQVFVVATDANLQLDGEFLIAAEGFGGDGANGGDAVGGFASLDMLNTNLTVDFDINDTSRILIETSGNAGVGTSGAGDATGGYTQLIVQDSDLSVAELFLSSEAEASGAALDAAGGTALAGLVEAIIIGASTVDANAFGMVATALSSIDGTATGGETELSIGGPQGAPAVNAANVLIDASASGGSINGIGTNAAGIFTIDIASGQMSADIFDALAIGDGDPSSFGASSITAIGGSLLITETLNVTVDDDFLVETGQGGIIGGPVISDPTAEINIISGNTVRFSGDDDNAISIGGALLSVTSNDIVINNGARLGAFAMTFVSTNTDDPAILGGGGTPGGGVTGEGYSFIGEELARLETGSFNFSAPVIGSRGPNDPDLVIRDVTASGTLDDGTQSISVSVIGTGGNARVEGVVAYVDASIEDTFSLSAEGRIEIVTPGGIGIVDPQGNPTGTLFLGADTIWVADNDLLALLRDDSMFTGRNDQLAVAASGSDDPLGYLRASGVFIDVGSQLLVRNTGTASAPGGILVGDLGLSISGGQSTGTQLDVFAYGARRDASGTLITGQDFYNEVNFNNVAASGGSTLYTDQSEFNDCLINSNDCGTPDPEPPITEGPEDPVIETINNPAVVEAAITSVQPVETSEAESDDDFGIDFPGLVEADDTEEDEDIDDPVASGGDSSLYGQNSGSVRVEGN